MSFFFFKQKTAYEMRISDWSSDVCSSDLSARAVRSSSSTSPSKTDSRRRAVVTSLTVLVSASRLMGSPSIILHSASHSVDVTTCFKHQWNASFDHRIDRALAPQYRAKLRQLRPSFRHSVPHYTKKAFIYPERESDAS